MEIEGDSGRRAADEVLVAFCAYGSSNIHI